MFKRDVVIYYLAHSRKIEAIKYVRAKTSLGLREAKHEVDVIEIQLSESIIEGKLDKQTADFVREVENGAFSEERVRDAVRAFKAQLLQRENERMMTPSTF